MLAKKSNLKITSRTSILQYRGVHRPLRGIAKDLGVDAVLEGSVGATGNETHVRMQLLDARTDTHLWAESYDRDDSGMVTLSGEAAQTIASRLNSTASVLPASRHVSPEAHDAYLRGRYLWFTDHTKEAGPYFRRSVDLQPDYALGWSGLGIYYGASAVKGELSPADSFAGLEQASSRALALDDSLPEAHLAEAGAAMAVRWDLRRAELETERATQLDPKFAEAYHLRAKILAAMNRHREAIEAQAKATELDPFSRPWAMTLALREARQYAAALKNGQDQLLVYPNDTILLGVIWTIYDRMGMEKESVDVQERCLRIKGRSSEAEELKKLFSTRGYRAVLERELAKAKERAKTTYVPPIELARLEAKLGHPEEAMALLEQTYRERSPGILWVQVDPAFDALHGQERYRRIVQQVGLPAAY
jgi:tetratricopeptide (TPR) repeat protein